MSAAYAEASASSSRNFRRVSRREHCPKCDRPDWCCIFDDGGIWCMRVASQTPCKSGGWMHWPNGRPNDWRERLAFAPPRRTVEPALAAEKERIDAAYRELLERCPLSAEDREHLRGRGLTDEQIARHGYGTLPADPAERQRIAAEVAAALGWDPVGIVPGFIRKDGRITLARLSGILIPSRNVKGLIRGVQVRLSNPGAGGPKYVWFSAGDGKDGGVGQNGHVCHIARPARASSTKRVVLCESPLKANIVADHFGCIALGVAGVSNTAGVLPALQALGGVEDVAVAYDKDAEINPQVAAAETKVAREMAEAGYRVCQWTWPLESGKGIDDFLTTGLLPFPIPHPAVIATHQNPEPAPDQGQQFRDLWRLNSITNAARRSPNLGAERHTLTDLALVLSAAPEGELVPMCYAKLGDQAGISASAAERHLGKVGVKPKERDAGLLTGLVEVQLLPGPSGRDATYMRRLAPVRDILERIATAPEPATGKRNNHGGRADRGCPKCGTKAIARTVTDRCAGCGELIKQRTVTIAGDAEDHGQQDAARPTDDQIETPTAGVEQDDDADGQHLAARAAEQDIIQDDDPPVVSNRGSNLPPVPSADDDRAARRAHAAASLAAWQDTQPVHEALAKVNRATGDEDWSQAAGELGEKLIDIGRQRGRSPVPKPSRAANPVADPEFGSPGFNRWTEA